MDKSDIALVERLKNTLLVARSDDFDVDYHNYLYGNEAQLAKLRECMRVRTFAVGGTGVAYRVINHWEQKKLLPKRDEDEGWRKFSFVELVWLKVISRLRKLGFPIEQIAKTKNGVMAWDKELHTYTLLEYYIVKAAASQIDPYVFVLPDGKATILSSREIEDYKGLFGSKDAVLISLKSILSELGVKNTKPETLRAVSYAEGALLNEMRGGEATDIRAKVKDRKLRKMENLSEVKKFGETLPLGDILSEVKNCGDDFFGVLSVKYQNGKQQSATISTVKRSKHFGDKSASHHSV
jgi:DNA-binding transcriptional MerR regulator